MRGASGKFEKWYASPLFRGVEVWAYCLMPNHVHLIAAPGSPAALAEAVGRTHLRYTWQVNQRLGWTGCLWQGRFASFPMDETYLRACARYVGQNPVRAGLAAHASDWPWSSVAAHLDGKPDPLLTPGPLGERLGAEMASFFELELAGEARERLRRASMTGRPLGPADWVKRLEGLTGQSLAAPPMGRPRKAPPAP